MDTHDRGRLLTPAEAVDHLQQTPTSAAPKRHWLSSAALVAGRAFAKLAGQFFTMPRALMHGPRQCSVASFLPRPNIPPPRNAKY